MALLIEHGKIIEIECNEKGDMTSKGQETLQVEYTEFRDRYWGTNTFNAIARDGYWLPFEEFMNMVNTCEIGIHFEIKHWDKQGELYGDIKNSSSINTDVAHVKPKRYSIEQLVTDLKVLNSGEEVDKLIITKSAIKRLMDKWDTINDSECDNKAIWFGLGAFQDGRPAVFIQYGRNPKLCLTYPEDGSNANYTNESNNPGRIPSS